MYLTPRIVSNSSLHFKMNSYKILLFLYQRMQMLNVKAGTSNQIMSPATWCLSTTTMSRNSQNLIKERLVVFDSYVNEYLKKVRHMSDRVKESEKITK